MGFPGGSDSKESAYIAGDLGPHKSPNISVKWDKRKLSSVTIGDLSFTLSDLSLISPLCQKLRWD